MKNILKFLTRKDLFLLLGIIILIIIQVNLDLLIPDNMAKMTQYLQKEDAVMSNIIRIGAVMIIIAIFSLLASLLRVIFNARLGTNYSASLRKGVFYKVQDLSLESENDFSVSSLITRTTNDISHIEGFLFSAFQSIIYALILGAGALIKIIKKDWHWSFATGLSIFLLIVLLVLCIMLTFKKFNKIQCLTDRLSNITRESFNGIQTIRVYNAEKYHTNKFNNVNDELTGINIFINKTIAILSPLANLLMNTLSLSIYYIGMLIINKAPLNEKVILFSDMIAYDSYAIQLATAFIMLFSIFLMIPQAFVSIRRISEVLECDYKIKDGNFLDKDNVKQTPSIEFRNVDFKYANDKDFVLENISFKANKGETIAIVGSTGSGKTTLVNLIPRFFDSVNGEILIDGVNVKEYSKKTLRDKIGYVSQKVQILSGSIASNVAYSDGKNEINSEAVYNSIKIANAFEFVDKLEEGIDYKIVNDGKNLSGGQKQRLAIARAIYRNPKILVFDDSFSALDYRTDLYIRSSVKKAFNDAIIIIVSQRVNNIINADKIIVLDKGKIVGIGKHNDLIHECNVYRQLVLSQLSEEEI